VNKPCLTSVLSVKGPPNDPVSDFGGLLFKFRSKSDSLYYKIVVFVIEVKPDFRAKLKLVFCCSIFKSWNFVEHFEQSNFKVSKVNCNLKLCFLE